MGFWGSWRGWLIQHFPEHDQYLAQLARALRQNGALILSIPNGTIKHLHNRIIGPFNPFHVALLSSSELGVSFVAAKAWTERRWPAGAAPHRGRGVPLTLGMVSKRPYERSWRSQPDSNRVDRRTIICVNDKCSWSTSLETGSGRGTTSRKLRGLVTMNPTQPADAGERPVLRILLTIHHTLDIDSGAPGTTLMLADGLRDLGHQVSVLGFDGMRPRLGARFDQLTFPLCASTRARRALRDNAVDVIDASTGDLWALPRSAVSTAQGVVVTRCHGLEHLVHLRQIEAAGRGDLNLSRRYFLYHGGVRLHQVARSLRIADTSVFLNAYERQWAVDHLGIPSDRAVVTRNGISPDLLGLPLAPTSKDDPIRIAIMGGYAWRKGASEAAAVLSRVLRRNPEIRASWLGADYDAVRSGIAADLMEHVTVIPRYRLA